MEKNNLKYRDISFFLSYFLFQQCFPIVAIGRVSVASIAPIHSQRPYLLKLFQKKQLETRPKLLTSLKISFGRTLQKFLSFLVHKIIPLDNNILTNTTKIIRLELTVGVSPANCTAFTVGAASRTARYRW